MRTRGNEVKFVRITCTGREGSEAKVIMNGAEAGTLNITTPDTEETILVPVPEEMQKSEIINVSINTAEDKMSPMIYEVRLVTE